MYDFDTPVDRRGTDSYKWDIGENELPMWVADMDFRTAPQIIDALTKRAAHGVFGYSTVPDMAFDAYIQWWKERHGFVMERDWLVFSTGVVPTLSSCVRKLTTPAEKVVIMTPVYNIFYNSILNNGRVVRECELDYDAVKGEYSINWDRLEECLSDPQTSLMILCNPHNPTGQIWDRETLANIGKMAYENGVTVISDEIHCDITAPGRDYVPYLSASDICREHGIACISPTKAFNLAGLQTSAVAVPDRILRHKVFRGLNTDECGEPNSFSNAAVGAAFGEGAGWLDEMRKYVFENRRLAEEYICENIPRLRPVRAEATYLMWIDVSSLNISSSLLSERIREETGLYVSYGQQYGKGGEHFIRMNIACPRSVMYDGLGRLEKAVGIIAKSN